MGQTPGEGTLHSSVGKCPSLDSDSFSGSAERRELCLPGSPGAGTPLWGSYLPGFSQDQGDAAGFSGGSARIMETLLAPLPASRPLPGARLLSSLRHLPMACGHSVPADFLSSGLCPSAQQSPDWPHPRPSLYSAAL